MDIDRYLDNAHPDAGAVDNRVGGMYRPVNMRRTFSPEQQETLRSALMALGRSTGLVASTLNNQVAEGNSRMAVTLPDGHVVEMGYVVKGCVDRHDQLSAFKYQHGDAVLVTQSLSNTMAEQCRARNIAFIDTSGNCLLRRQGLFVFVSGRKDAAAPQAATMRGMTPAALHLIFAVLAKPAILDGSVRQIADVAGISHGAAGIALVMLGDMGLLGKATTGRRMMTLPERWLDAWTEGYLGRLRPKLTSYRMRSPVELASLIEQVTPALRALILGGEAAAAYSGLGLTPGVLTLYVDLQNAHVLPNLVRQCKLHRDPSGNVELVEMFWNAEAVPSFPTVPDALVYADLIGSGDDRTLEIAGLLKQRIIDHVASETR